VRTLLELKSSSLNFILKKKARWNPTGLFVFKSAMIYFIIDFLNMLSSLLFVS